MGAINVAPFPTTKNAPQPKNSAWSEKHAVVSIPLVSSDPSFSTGSNDLFTVQNFLKLCISFLGYTLFQILRHRSTRRNPETTASEHVSNSEEQDAWNSPFFFSRQMPESCRRKKKWQKIQIWRLSSSVCKVLHSWVQEDSPETFLFTAKTFPVFYYFRIFCRVWGPMFRVDLLTPLFGLDFFSSAFPYQYSSKSLQTESEISIRLPITFFFSHWKLLRCLVFILRRGQRLKSAMFSLNYNYCPRSSQVFKYSNILWFLRSSTAVCFY